MGGEFAGQVVLAANDIEIARFVVVAEDFGDAALGPMLAEGIAQDFDVGQLLQGVAEIFRCFG
jgi:hypothetical protein